MYTISSGVHMKLTPEIVTVFPDLQAGEVHIVLSGFRITLTADESSLLLDGLIGSLERLRAAQKPETGGGELAWRVARHVTGPAEPPNPPAQDALADSAQQRLRASVQATIRDKGLSLREE